MSNNSIESNLSGHSKYDSQVSQASEIDNNNFINMNSASELNTDKQSTERVNLSSSKLDKEKYEQ